MYSEQAAEPLTPTRKRIYAAAMKLFAELGVTRVSISELAAAAGMARGTIYSNVNDLDGLFEEVAAQLVREMTERVTQGIGGHRRSGAAHGNRDTPVHPPRARRAGLGPLHEPLRPEQRIASGGVLERTDRRPARRDPVRPLPGHQRTAACSRSPRSAVPHWRRCSPCWKDMARGATSVPTPRSWCWSPSASLARRRGRSRGASWHPCRAPTEGPGTDRASRPR